MTLVVDASVAAKWALEEDGFDPAVALRDRWRPFYCTFIDYRPNRRCSLEACGAQRRVRARRCSRPSRSLFARLIPPAESRSIELAIELRHSICDCFLFTSHSFSASIAR